VQTFAPEFAELGFFKIFSKFWRKLCNKELVGDALKIKSNNLTN